MKNKKTKKQRGFTLIELLLYLGIAAAMIMAISIFLVTLLQARVKNQAVAEVEQQGAQVMDQILQLVRNAEGVTSPAVGESGNSIEIDVIDAAKDPTLIEIQSGTIQISEGGGAWVPLTNSRVQASNLGFENVSLASTPGSVKVTFDLSHVNNLGRNELDYSESFTGSAALR